MKKVICELAIALSWLWRNSLPGHSGMPYPLRSFRVAAVLIGTICLVLLTAPRCQAQPRPWESIAAGWEAQDSGGNLLPRVVQLFRQRVSEVEPGLDEELREQLHQTLNKRLGYLQNYATECQTPRYAAAITANRLFELAEGMAHRQAFSLSAETRQASRQEFRQVQEEFIAGGASIPRQFRSFDSTIELLTAVQIDPFQGGYGCLMNSAQSAQLRQLLQTANLRVKRHVMDLGGKLPSGDVANGDSHQLWQDVLQFLRSLSEPVTPQAVDEQMAWSIENTKLYEDISREISEAEPLEMEALRKHWAELEEKMREENSPQAILARVKEERRQQAEKDSK